MPPLCLPLLPPPPLPIKADWMPAAFWTACIRRRWGSQCPPLFAPQTWEALFCQQPPSLLHHPHPCHGFCALAETEVGLDAEQLGRPVRPALVKKVLSSQEYCLWQQAEDPDRLFLSLWTLKEATVKYTGDGLRGYPNHLSF